MTSLWQVPSVVVLFVTWFTSPPTSIGDASRREALRRQLAPRAETTLTNVGMPRELPVLSTAAAEPRPVTPPARTVPPGVQIIPDDELVAPPPRTAKPAQAPASSVAAQAAATQQGTATQSEGASAGQGDEKAWRDKMSGARQSLERNEGLVDAMQSRVNSLQTDVVNRDDPAQQAQLRQQLSKALSELDRLKKVVDGDRKAITDIQNEARKQGVPPGWVR